MRGQVASRLAVGVLVAALLGGCAAWCRKSHGSSSSGAAADADWPAGQTASADLKPSKPGASFATAGPALGNHDLQPCCCVSGDHYQFLGADLVDEEHHLVVRTLEDPLYGTAVRVFDDHDADGKTFVLHRRDCRRLDAKLRRTGSWINGINVMSLELDLDCTTSAGDAIAGSFKANECG